MVGRRRDPDETVSLGARDHGARQCPHHPAWGYLKHGGDKGTGRLARAAPSARGGPDAALDERAIAVLRIVIARSLLRSVDRWLTHRQTGEPFEDSPHRCAAGDPQGKRAWRLRASDGGETAGRMIVWQEKRLTSVAASAPLLGRDVPRSEGRGRPSCFAVSHRRLSPHRSVVRGPTKRLPSARAGSLR